MPPCLRECVGGGFLMRRFYLSMLATCVLALPVYAETAISTATPIPVADDADRLEDELAEEEDTAPEAETTSPVEEDTDSNTDSVEESETTPGAIVQEKAPTVPATRAPDVENNSASANAKAQEEAPVAPAVSAPGVDNSQASPGSTVEEKAPAKPAASKTGVGGNETPPGAEVQDEAAASSAEDAAANEKKEADKAPPKAFMKGELTEFGIVQLMNQRTSFGVSAGIMGIDGMYYGVIRPDLNLRLGDFNLGLGAPLRFQLFDTSKFTNALDPNSYSDVFEGAGQFRREDWDQIEDYLRPLRYFTWGKKEDRFYLDLNRARAFTIGHGQLMRRYSPNVDIDEDNLFAQLDAYSDLGGFELVAGPLPLPRIVGGLLFVKPLGLFSDGYMAKSLSIGVSYLTDLNAPTVLLRQTNDAGESLLPIDDANQLLHKNSASLLGDRVQGFGVDAEVKLVKSDFIDIKTYVDYSQLMMPAASNGDFDGFSDGGFTAGTLFRLSFGEKPVRDFDDEPTEVQQGKAPREMKAAHAFRLRAEGRVFGPQYLPSYFDTLYEVDKMQFDLGDPSLSRADLPTKLGFLASQANEPWRVGHYLEFSYTWVDVVGFTAMYEDAWRSDTFENVSAARNMAFHAETFGLGWIQLFATYHLRHFDDFGTLFTFSSDSEILYAGGRVALLPILYLNFGVQRAFRTGFGPNDDPMARNPVDGIEGTYRNSSLGLINAWNDTYEVELGWQF